ncbi:MAG: hypothetical protein RLZZ546_756, partial [Bacteroidota bacterium]
MKNLCKLVFGNLLIFSIIISLNFKVSAQCPSDTIAYVKEDASGSNDGSSWANAFTDLQSALNCTNLKEIWVAQGAYPPSLDTNLMTPSQIHLSVFKMRNNLKIIGGFAGTETSITQRINILPTYLSRIHNPALPFQNSVNMIYNNDPLDSTAVLDGFIIDGYNESYLSFGSAIVNRNASPTFKNITITFAFGYDGTIQNINSSSSYENMYVHGCGVTTNGAIFYNINSDIKVEKSNFIGNGSGINGGAFYCINGSLVLNNSFIEQGNANFHGGAIYADNANITCTNVAFSFCNTEDEGATMFLTNNSFLDMTNCSMHAGYSTNFQTTGGGIFAELGSIIEIKNSIIWDNTGEVTIDNIVNASVSNSIIKGGFLGAYDIDPQFKLAQQSGTAHPDLRLRECSPAIDLGDDTFNSMSLDLDGNPRLFEGVPGGNLIDLGAYEKQVTYFSSTTRWYVDSSSVFSGNGRSWECAFKTIDEALSAAVYGDSIFVKAGTYYAITKINNDNRSATFSLKAGVKMFGGFNGTEVNINQRSLGLNKTILSGNGVTPGYYLDDSYHVVYSKGMGIDTNTVLDGFIIQNGLADASYDGGKGSAIYIEDSSPKIRSVKINGEMGIINGAISFKNS